MSTDQIGFTEFADSDPFTLLTVGRWPPARSHDHYTPKRVCPIYRNDTFIDCFYIYRHIYKLQMYVVSYVCIHVHTC